MAKRGPYKLWQHVGTNKIIPKETARRHFHFRERQNYMDDKENDMNEATTNTVHDELQALEESLNNSVEDGHSSQEYNMDHHSSDDDGVGSGDDDFDAVHDTDAEASASNEFHDEMISNGDTAIFPGSDVTRADVLIMVVAFMTRFSLSATCAQHLLQLLNCIVPGCIPQTKYYIDKLFKHIGEETVTRHYYCHTCKTLQGSNFQKCLKCNDIVGKDSFFLQLPVEPQLRTAMEQFYMFRKEVDFSNNNPTSISDITSGLKYKDLEWFLRRSDNVTLSWSCDGVPIFNSSKFSIWPVTVIINELEYEVRNRCPILCFLWFGVEKPSMNMYLEPFVNVSKNLFNVGFVWTDCQRKEHVSKAVMMICSCDSVARPLLQNIKQFNGYNGCGFCLQLGEHLNGKNIMVYPLVSPVPLLRSREGTISDAETAVNSSTVVRGVKGPTTLALMPNFDIVDGMVPDTMHAAMLGIVRQFVALWLDSKHSLQQYYIGRKINEVNVKLVSIRCPDEVRRQPRSLNERKFWKATEWKSFLLVYSVIILQGILPTAHYQHWCLLVYAFQMLQSQSITTQTLISVELSLLKFVNDIKVLYGKEHNSYNCHLLTHVCNAVRNFGLPWAWSCFVFENFYGKLSKKFHGTQHVGLQICKNTLMEKKLSVVAAKKI